MNVQERFERNVPERPEKGCWIWGGSKQASGYGQMSVGTRSTRVTHLAHRLAYELFVGQIPQGLEVEHLCEVKGCVRWSEEPGFGPHLRLATHGENMRTSRMRIGYGKFQRSKSACPQGHPYSEENTYRTPTGGRQCRTCKNERQRAKRAQFKTYSREVLL